MKMKNTPTCHAPHALTANLPACLFAALLLLPWASPEPAFGQAVGAPEAPDASAAASAPGHAGKRKAKAHKIRPATSKQADAALRTPAFSEMPAVHEFIREMHERHGFDADELMRHFSAVHRNAVVLKAIQPAAVPEQQRSWQRYRARFLNERRIGRGLDFWQEHEATLARAEAVYGVPPEIVVAIIGVETEYGRNTGKFSVLEALSTLAFEYPPRAPFFRGELEQLLLMAQENGLPPTDYRGSYAGAIGIPQFMPGSQRRFAVDFDGDGRIDLRRSDIDAIGSVARYLNMHGWQSNAPVALPVRVDGDPAPPDCRRHQARAAARRTGAARRHAARNRAERTGANGQSGRMAGGANRPRHAGLADGILGRLRQLLRHHALQPVELLRHVGLPACRSAAPGQERHRRIEVAPPAKPARRAPHPGFLH